MPLPRRYNQVTNIANATRIHRATPTRNHSRILNCALACLRLIVLTVSLILGINGVIKNPADNNAKEIALLLLKKAPQYADSIKRLRRRN